MKKAVVFLVFILTNWAAFSQDQSISLQMASKSIPVTALNGDTLLYPFAGGLNNCQYSAIDLDLDGKMDLLVFDRHGNRLLPFLIRGNKGSTTYEFAPRYVDQLPVLKEWVECLDYDADGKNDIFTYTTGGIKVFRNESVNSLKFRQVSYPYLVSQQGAGLTNILVTYADYPAISDLDHDGDLDILTFWGLGSFVEWHRNTSMELYGNADSLCFEKSSSCWGHFAEAGESNGIQLDTCVTFGDYPFHDGDPKHTGSTLLAGDLNGDALPDLVIGDVDFPTVVCLSNGGTLDTAVMTSQTTVFPDPVHPVDLPTFPVISRVDVNQDGLYDLIASSFEPSLLRSETSKSSWLYLNTSQSSSGAQKFVFQKADFLQEDMLDFGSGAYPLLLDVNGDGLLDMLVGNYGVLDSVSYSPSTGLKCQYLSSLALLENTGTLQSPAFQLVSTDYLGLSALEQQSVIPAAGDLDADGDTDLLCGNAKGKFIFLENTAGAGNPASFVLSDPAYKDLDAGDFSAPALVDLDSDGLLDIVSGRRDGRLTYYHNLGPASSPVFQKVTDSLGGVDVTNTNLSYYGYSVPFFYQHEDGSLGLLVGSEFGDIYAYSTIENHLDGNFQLAGKANVPNQGLRTAICLGNLDHDGQADVMIGNYSGGLGYFQGMTITPYGIPEISEHKEFRLLLVPNPVKDILYVDVAGAISRKTGIVRLFSVDGKLRRIFDPITMPARININGLTPGIYFISFSTKELLITGKIIVGN